MAINLGSMVALFAGPIIASRYGYSPAYIISAIGLILGLLNYFLQRKYVADIHTQADKRKITWVQWLIVGAGILLFTEVSAYLLQHVILAKNLLLLITFAVILSYFYFMKQENKNNCMKMGVALVLMFEAIIFFILYQQMPTSLNLFAVNNVNPSFFGINLDPQSFQALNPIWIVTLSPLLAYLYSSLSKKKVLITSPYKFALGMTMCGFSFLLLYFARYFHTDNGIVSSWWLIASYLFQSLGELLVSALGVAMVAELVPASITGFVMGIWYLTTAISGFLGATVASYTALPTNVKPGIDSLMIYTKVFAYIGIVTLVIALFMWLLAPILNRYIISKEESEENKDTLNFSMTASS